MIHIEVILYRIQNQFELYFYVLHTYNKDKVNALLDRRMCFVPATTHICVSFIYVSFC